MGIFDKTPIRKLLTDIAAINAGELFISVISDQQTRKDIVKLNTNQMKLEFKNSEGVLLSDIGGGYADQTLADGKKQGRFKVDLYLSGEFHESFEVVNVTSSGFTIKSNPIMDDGTNLFNRWGEEIEGLTFESLDKLSLFLIPRYQSDIRKKLIL